MKQLMLICLMLVGCTEVRTCKTNSDCNETEYCYCTNAMYQSCTCRETIQYYKPVNTTYKYYTFNNNYSDSPPIECEKEEKVIWDKYWGYEMCVRCKDLNRSVWEGVIPAGDWIC